MRERPEKKGGYEMRLSPRTMRALNRSQKKKETNDVPEDLYQMSDLDVSVMQQLLDVAQFRTLASIFFEHLLRSGVPPHNANLAALKNITLDRMSSRVAATYSPFYNEIALSAKNKLFKRAKRILREGKPIPDQLMYSFQLDIIHELCHAFGRVRFTTKDISDARIQVTTEVGYDSAHYALRAPGRPEKRDITQEGITLYNAFNEGVTQRIAEEVFWEYHKRMGNTSGAKQYLSSRLLRRTNRGKRVWTYYMFGNHVDSMCEAIARYTDVPKEKVWESIKRGYFEKPELYNEETVNLFKQTFGEDVLYEYAMLKTDDPEEKFIQFDKKYSIPPVETYVQRWLDHLGIAIEQKKKRRKKKTR